MDEIDRKSRFAVWFRLIMVLMVLMSSLFILSHCGDDDDDSSDPTATPIPSVTPTETPGSLMAPILSSPANGETILYFNPKFTVMNSPSSSTEHNLWYEFRVAYDNGMTDIVIPFPDYYLAREGQNGFTSWQWESGLIDQKVYYWSCRVTNGEMTSPWAHPSRFTTNVCQNLFHMPEFPPPGPDAYADAVVSADINDRDNCFRDTAQCLGAPNASGSGSDESTYTGIVSLGYGGGITVDMGAGESIINGSGVDFKVHQFVSEEAIQVWVSQDGITYHDLGIKSNPYEFDLSWGGLPDARFVTIYDRSSTNRPDYNAHTPGADIDAVEAYYY